METIEHERPYEYDATRIDIYIAALLQGAVERGELSLRGGGCGSVSADDKDVIERIIDLAAATSLERHEQFYGKVPK
jgi:hypothetical protein